MQIYFPRLACWIQTIANYQCGGTNKSINHFDFAHLTNKRRLFNEGHLLGEGSSLGRCFWLILVASGLPSTICSYWRTRFTLVQRSSKCSPKPIPLVSDPTKWPTGPRQPNDSFQLFELCSLIGLSIRVLITDYGDYINNHFNLAIF